MTRILSTEDIRSELIERQEIAMFDLRDEATFAEAHPLFAASLPLERIELEVLDRVPRLSTTVVVYDDWEGLVSEAVSRLQALGYTGVATLEGGLSGWRAAGGELFRDVNVPSKAFGELVEARRHTPSISADELKSLLSHVENVVVLDARRQEEYQTMSIPTAVSVPGGELVYRVGALVDRPDTLVVVNCAGRTRSIIGTQSLVNAAIVPRVAALRNGTIGWVLDGHTLEHGQARTAPPVSPAAAERAAAAARRVADRAGVRRATAETLAAFRADTARTTYMFDVRTPDEYVGRASRRVPLSPRWTTRTGDRRVRARPRRAYRALGRPGDARGHDRVMACADGVGGLRTRRAARRARIREGTMAAARRCCSGA